MPIFVNVEVDYSTMGKIFQIFIKQFNKNVILDILIKYYLSEKERNIDKYILKNKINNYMIVLNNIFFYNILSVMLTYVISDHISYL
jgi:hypothetical protein